MTCSSQLKRNVPLWVTEWGWSGAPQVGETLQAAYLARSLDMLRILYPYVTVATYFVAVDDGAYYFSGLFDASYNPKPAAAVFAEFMSSS